MYRVFGILKVIFITAIDFLLLYSLSDDLCVASAVVAVIILYIVFGGYLALIKEGAVNAKRLPAYQRDKLETAKTQLAADVKSLTGANISRVQLYLIPADNDMNAAAYGFASGVSVTRGTLENVDSLTLNAVLGHEISHILNLDAEFNRAVFCSVTLLIAALSFASLIATIFIFLLFLVLNCFRSWLGVMAYRGTTKVVSGFFNVLQLTILVIYRLLLSLASRHAEYRSDKFSCTLGYGVQLIHFFSLIEPNSHRQLTLTEAIYRSHPPTLKRIARAEAIVNSQNQMK